MMCYKPGMNRSVVRVLVGIILTVLIVAGAAGGFIWWKISQLKETLARDLGQALGAQVEVTSVNLDPWKGELHAAGINLTNERPEQPWDKGAISQATVHYHLTDLFSSSIPLSVEVSDWSVVLHTYTSSVVPPDTEPTPPPANTPGSSSGHSVRITDLQATEGNVEIDLSGNQKVLMQTVGFKASDNGAGVWATDLQTGTITAGTLNATSGKVHILGSKDDIAFSDLRLDCEQGFVGGHGDIAMAAPHKTEVVLKATALPIAMLLSSPWQMKISGNVNGDVTYDSDDTAASATGHLSMDKARFNVLPWLGKVTAMISLPDFSDLELDQATSDFTWKDHVFHFTNIDLRKNDVARISGTLDLNALDMVDGKLKLGFPSAVIGKWPLLQSQVFSETSDGYNWTDVHVTGTPDNLKEDLTSRVAATAIQSGSEFLQQTKQDGSDLLQQTRPRKR